MKKLDAPCFAQLIWSVALEVHRNSQIRNLLLSIVNKANSVSMIVYFVVLFSLELQILNPTNHNHEGPTCGPKIGSKRALGVPNRS